MDPERIMQMVMELQGASAGGSYRTTAPQQDPRFAPDDVELQRLKWHLEDEYGITDFESQRGKDALAWMVDRHRNEGIRQASNRGTVGGGIYPYTDGGASRGSGGR